MTESPGTAPPWLWVDWDRHLRTHSLCRRLGIELLEICVPAPRLLRYLSCARQTLRAIRTRRPAVVIATNPSIALGLLLLLVRRWYRFALVADAHYAGVEALSGSVLLQRLLDFYNAQAALVIVTNEVHARLLQSRGAQAFVCPDPLPLVTQAPTGLVAVPPKSVFLVCSFDADEPWAQAFAAFGELSRGSGFTLFVSGNYRKAQLSPAGFPGVRLLGFLPQDAYYAYLRACDLVMDLTVLENCLVCGAYEALAAGKPLITSASNALRSYFAGAAVFTAHDPAAIARAVEEAYAGRERLRLEGGAWSARNEQYLGERLAGLGQVLQALALQVQPARQAS